jgi:hypothetical protein
MAWTSTMKRSPPGTAGVALTGAAKPIATSSNPDAAIPVSLMHLISRSGVVVDRAMSDCIGAKRSHISGLRLLEPRFKCLIADSLVSACDLFLPRSPIGDAGSIALQSWDGKRINYSLSSLVIPNLCHDSS